MVMICARNVVGSGNLHLFNVNCFGVISNGDSVNFATTYTLTPKQVITSP
jgi:protein involved in ribonucleotide reduction